MRLKTLIACASAVVLLAAGIAVLSFWQENPPQPDNVTPPPPDTGELIRAAADEVSGVFFYPRDDLPYALRRIDGGDVELDAPDAVFPARQSHINLAHNFATSLFNLPRVTADADDAQLALFGLDDPVMKWRVEMTGGSSVELAAGAVQAAGQGRYARRTDSREVFLLTELQSNYLTRTLESLYDLSFFPLPPSASEEQIWNAIEHLLLETADGVIELIRRTDEEMENAQVGASRYRILQPFEGETNEAVQHILLEHITRIIPGGIHTLLPADLSLYGLDAPDRLTVTADGRTATLLIGGRDAERGGRYVMIEDYGAVLFDANSSYSFLDADASQLRTQIVWLYDIKDVSSLTFVLDGVTRVLELEHNAEEESLRGRLDGVELTETNARRLYLAALRVNQSGLTEAAVPDQAPVYSITIGFPAGASELLELYRINDSEFLIAYNGVSSGMFVTRMSLQQNLLSRFEALDRGEDIPRF
jgi:hypothetical protein